MGSGTAHYSFIERVGSDFVLVADLKSDQLGFPSDVEDDPLLSLVLAKETLSQTARNGAFSMSR